MFRQLSRIANHPVLAIMVFVPLLGGYIIAGVGYAIWYLLKGLWFVLCVLPARGIKKLNENIDQRRLENAKDRMTEYEDDKS